VGRPFVQGAEVFRFDQMVKDFGDDHRLVEGINPADEGRGLFFLRGAFLREVDGVAQDGQPLFGRLSIGSKDVGKNNSVGKAVRDVILPAKRMGDGVDVTDVAAGEGHPRK